MCAFSFIPILAFNQEGQVFATARSKIATVEESIASVAAIVVLSIFKHPRKTNPMAV